MRLIAFDTEDDSNGTPHMINFFDGVRHRTFERKDTDNLDDFRCGAWNWLYAQAPAYVWACNAEYDLINLFGSWLGKMVTLQYVSSGLLRGSLRDCRITVFDTLRHWPMSVEQMGEFLKLPKLDADFHSVEYCRRDTEIVFRFVSEMLGRYEALGLTTKATLPSMALQLFKKRFYKKEFIALPPKLVAWLRGGYYGGRVEVYRFGSIPGPIHHYDVNSLFPSVMVEGTYPNPGVYRYTNRPDWKEEGMASVTLQVPPSEYPALPIRGGTDIMYPYGVLTGTWCYPEIRQALEDGAEIIAVHEAVEFAPMRTPFKEYIEFCYGQRLQAEKATLDDVLWKLYMNSLYGKFGQKARLEMIYDDKNLVIESKPSAAANVVWAAYVTSLARLRLLGYLRATTTCHYTDTDSLLTPDVLPTSTVLGALKLEGTYDSMEAMGNKMYAWYRSTHERLNSKGRCIACGRFPTDSCEVYKAKGVPKKVASDFIRTGRAVYRKPARFRESRRTSAVANKWYEVEKVRQAIYTKRMMLEGGGTAPWDYAEYREVHGG